MENVYNYTQALILFDNGEYKELQSFTGLRPTEFKQQMCDFLINELHWSTRQVANLLGYAMSTVRKYAKTIKCTIINFLKTAYVGIKTKLSFKQTQGVAYLIYLYDRPNHIKYLKVGKTIPDRIHIRMKEHEKKYNCKVEIIKLFLLNNENQALTLENIMRQHFIEKNNGADFEPNDRFTMSRVTKQDLYLFDQKAKMIIDNF